MMPPGMGGPTREQQFRMAAAGVLQAAAQLHGYQPDTLRQWVFDCDEVATFLDKGTTTLKSRSIFPDKPTPREQFTAGMKLAADATQATGNSDPAQDRE